MSNDQPGNASSVAGNTQARSAAPWPLPSKARGDCLRPDAVRIAEMIEMLAHVGKEAGGGVSRLAFTELERKAHEMLRTWLAEQGLRVWSDAIGNTFAELPGKEENLPAIGSGSHLDSVPHGGRFDGVAGVVAAVEAVRILGEEERLHHPVRLVAFAAEEGARFGEPCIGSKAAAGRWSPRTLDMIRDGERVTVAEAMRAVGLDPTAIESCRWHPSDWEVFLELHVEQGGVLEAAGQLMGLVDTVSGSTRVAFTLRGQAQHTGATPMSLRADALAAASEIVLAAEDLTRDPHYRGTRASVGKLDVFPNSLTTIAGETTLALDVRDTDNDRQRQAASVITAAAERLCARRNVECTHEVIADTSPVVLPIWVRKVLESACESLGVPYRVMASGASHDCQIINSIVPAALLFVPSKGGLSHVAAEWTSATDIASGVAVLVESIVRLDELLMHLDTVNEVSSSA